MSQSRDFVLEDTNKETIAKVVENRQKDEINAFIAGMSDEALTNYIAVMPLSSLESFISDLGRANAVDAMLIVINLLPEEIFSKIFLNPRKRDVYINGVIPERALRDYFASMLPRSIEEFRDGQGESKSAASEKTAKKSEPIKRQTSWLPFFIDNRLTLRGVAPSGEQQQLLKDKEPNYGAASQSGKPR